MKNIKILAVMTALIMGALTACAGNRLFANLPKSDNLSVVYISKAMMRMGLAMTGKGDSEMGKITGAVKNANGMEVVSADSPAMVELLRKETALRIKDLGMELMLNTRDGEESVNIYTGKQLDDNTVRNILIVTDEPGEYNVVYILGDINLSAITSD